jgi:hypothetical protein
MWLPAECSFQASEVGQTVEEVGVFSLEPNRVIELGTEILVCVFESVRPHLVVVAGGGWIERVQ